MSEFTPTDRTRVRRKPDRGHYDRETVYRILDEAFVCHLGFVADGMPFVVPTNYVRVGDKLFLHGSPGSRLMKTLASGAPFCLSVTLLDGIVFAPTAMGHSVNYRSVVVMGKAEVVEGHAAKLAAMRDFVEYVVRGRWETVRPPTEQEIKATMVLAVPLVEASAKVRTGFAVDVRRSTAPRRGRGYCRFDGHQRSLCETRAGMRRFRFRRTSRIIGDRRRSEGGCGTGNAVRWRQDAGQKPQGSAAADPSRLRSKPAPKGFQDLQESRKHRSRKKTY